MVRRMLKAILLRLPFHEAILDIRRRQRKKQRYAKEAVQLSRLGGPEQVFTHHFMFNRWGDKESASGSGSTVLYTANLRRQLPALVREHGVRTVLDAPCGDYNWFRLIEFHEPIQYIGGDIVEPLVRQNQSRFGDNSRGFRHLDITRDALPKADLWLCRDCLFHLSDSHVMLAIENFFKSDIRFLLTSTHPMCDGNIDIPTGSFRLLNLQLQPFDFGPPITSIEDWIEGFPVRQLALWERTQLQTRLLSNKAFRKAISSRTL